MKPLSISVPSTEYLEKGVRVSRTFKFANTALNLILGPQNFLVKRIGSKRRYRIGLGGSQRPGERAGSKCASDPIYGSFWPFFASKQWG